ncbi:MAG: serine/threonine-protein kinase [Solirubrobacterales bacterium]
MAEGMTLAVGSELAGRYRLEQVIGAGGMATVWRAEDRELERSVAIKALSETLLADPAYVARFEREAKIAAGLVHPHLVKVFDYGAGEGRPYLVMEYVEGSTLAALIASGDPSIDADRLAAELLDALRQIHAAGVVHRDVKPANILVDRAGTAKLTDFGIARPADATQLTQTGQVIGTLAYMAPEVKEGREADERSDLYSLGVVLRECARAGGSAALISLTDRLTAAAPGDRPPSAEAALALLDRGGPAATAEPTVPLARRPGRRRRGLLAVPLALAAAAALILLVALDSGDGGSSGSAAGSGRDRPPTKERSTPTTEQPSQQPTAPSATATPEPQTAPAPAPIPCDQLEDRRHALEDQRKAAGEAAGDDKDAKKQIEEIFKAREERLKRREETCAEAAKAAEGAEEDVPPGLEGKGGVPPGQAKKEEK